MRHGHGNGQAHSLHISNPIDRHSDAADKKSCDMEGGVGDKVRRIRRCEFEFPLSPNSLKTTSIRYPRPFGKMGIFLSIESLGRVRELDSRRGQRSSLFVGATCDSCSTSYLADLSLIQHFKRRQRSQKSVEVIASRAMKTR